MHALGPENGELWVGPTSCRSRVLRGLQNVPVYYVAVVRDGGVAYYVSSVEGAQGLSPYPWLRPVGIEYSSLPDAMYVGLQQSVLGQIGFRLDTRVYGVRVACLGDWDSWHSGAHAADASLTEELQDGTLALRGDKWQVSIERHSPGRIAVLDPGEPSGLVHATVEHGGDSPVGAGLVWRFRDEANHWRLELTAGSCDVVLLDNGTRTVVASRGRQGGPSRGSTRLQVLDDGTAQMAYVDGAPMSDAWLQDERLQSETKVGIWWGVGGDRQTSIGRFEAHPRVIHMPAVLDMGAPWLRKGSAAVIEDDFGGAAGDLEGRWTTSGAARWRRMIGRGVIETTGGGVARVRASATQPCPGRTAYCVDWPHSEFVDVEASITPPDDSGGNRHRTTAGFILYQDARNYVTLNVYRWDYYPSGSVSTFFKFGGFEDVYDAIWSNVADRVKFGQAMRLRLCCDGERYVVLINEEVVLIRAFRDVYPDIGKLRINKVGIVANWEFGTDTGSTFEQFKLRA